MKDAKELEALLTAIQEIIKSNAQHSIHQDERGERFNVFSLCGVDHYEVIHSRILSEFLNPRGSHGQTDGSFLEAFFMMLARREPESGVIGNYMTIFRKFDKNTIVKTELSIKQGGLAIGRFDIYLENPKEKVACIIENKIFAGEQPEQIKRYSEWLKTELEEKYGYKTCLLFLTLDGHKAETCGTEEYFRVAYYDGMGNDILAWLKKCRQLACDKPFVRETIAQYGHHIENLINGGQIMANEVIEYLKKNLMAAQVIYDQYVLAQNEKATEMFVEFSKWMCSRDDYKMCVSGKEFEIQLDASHKEKGLLWPLVISGKEISVFMGFELTGLRAFFIGVTKERLPEEIRQVEQSIWEKTLKEVDCDEWNNWDTTDKCWAIWRYVKDEYCNWDGKFLALIDSNLFEKEALFNHMAQILKAIYRVVEVVLCFTKQQLDPSVKSSL